MRRILPIAFTVLACFALKAQETTDSTMPEHNWNFGLYYPVSIGQDFGSSNEGLIGVNLGYRFAEFGNVRLGVAADAAWFATTFINDSDPIQEEEYRDLFLQVRLFAEAPLTSNEKLKLIGGIGWGLQRAISPTFFDNQGQIQGEDINSGLLLSAGLTYDFAPRWYAAGQYDLMFLSGDSPNRSVGLLKLGVGFRF